jgi:uncharacterized FAD-dependent dehydrogenase
MDKYDIAIIGAGVSGAFSALRISENYKSAKTILIDLGRPPGKRRRFLEGFLGCLPNGDGKLYINNTDQISQIVDGRKCNAAIRYTLQAFNSVGNCKTIKDTLPSVRTQKLIDEQDFVIKTNDYIQWKPEHIHKLSKYIADKLESSNNITYSFDNEVYKISKKKNTFTIITANNEITCKKLILCVGRSGWRWSTNLYKELGITTNDDIARYGIRAEMSAQYMKDFNKSHCSLHKDDLDIGPFSWNGSVIPEDHADVVISSFRSNEDRWKSDKVSFSIIGSKKFPGTGVYQTDRLAKLAFLLFEDRVNKEKIKLLLKNDSQLSLLPEYLWIKDTIIELEKIIPNLSTRGYFYAPTILPLASKINLASNLESDIIGMYVCGESGGFSGIFQAAVTGIIAADSACK